MLVKDSNEIRECLHEIGKYLPRNVKSELKKGDMVEKSMGLSYEIDDPELYKRLADIPPGKIPYGKIFKHFRTDEAKTHSVFQQEGEQRNDTRVLPFSKVYEAETGECAEKSIMAQLFAQKERDSFYVSGGMSFGTDDFLNRHAYNIVVIDGTPVLIDVENPQCMGYDNGKAEWRPFIAPVIGIAGDGEVKIPDEWRDARYIHDNKFQIPDDWEDGREYYFK